MTDKEKARAYDEALKQAKKELKTCGNLDCDAARQIFRLFPELKENEDERIKKDIIILVKDWWDRVAKDNISTKEQMLAWLEKQGEQKPADRIKPKFKVGDIIRHIPNELNDLRVEYKITRIDDKFYYSEYEDGTEVVMFGLPAQDTWELVKQKPDKAEPKFKVRDWIVTPENKVLQITSIEGTRYCFNNVSHYWEICYCDEKCHLWTIQDAKDGDVLCYEDEVFILRDYTLFFTITYHCCYYGKNFIPHSIYSLTMNDFNKIHPATKEQRDTLIKAMTDAGYAFDFERKELKKIL